MKASSLNALRAVQGLYILCSFVLGGIILLSAWNQSNLCIVPASSAYDEIALGLFLIINGLCSAWYLYETTDEG